MFVISMIIIEELVIQTMGGQLFQCIEEQKFYEKADFCIRANMRFDAI